MNWRVLNSVDQLQEILKESEQKPVAIFKHSTRCSTSTAAKNRIERQWRFDDESLPIYFLDLIQYREVSNEIAEKLNVRHQSPQLLVIRNGKCVYDASHLFISLQDLEDQLSDLAA